MQPDGRPMRRLPKKRARLDERDARGGAGRLPARAPVDPPGRTLVGPGRRTVVLGDLHGDSVGLRAILLQAGLIDLFGRWCGGNARLIQVGDCIDRGPDSEGVVELLGRLQHAAEATGGEVVRLVGNHELDLAAGRARTRSGVRDPARLSARLRDEMATGRLVAAAGVGGFLFIHGGFTAASLKNVRTWIGGPVVSPRALAAALNRLLCVAALTGRLSGGPFAQDGPFRTYAPAELRAGARAPDFVQVVGHEVHDTPFCGLPHLLTVDQGVSVAMRGRRSFLQMELADETPGGTATALRDPSEAPAARLTWWYQDRLGRWSHERRRLARPTAPLPDRDREHDRDRARQPPLPAPPRELAAAMAD